jgi:hypoxanthine phosphoribosyltransferase
MFAFRGKRLTPLIAAEAIADKVAEMGRAITHDYADVGEDLVLVGVMKGSVVFLADLARAIDLPLTMELIGIASYGDATSSSGVVQITADLTRPIEGKHVIICEDIVDTGLTVAYLLDNLGTRKPKSLKVAALLSKPERSIQPVPIQYLGFTIPNHFVVGYGLDYAQRYRNLAFIGLLEPEPGSGQPDHPDQ